MMADNKLKLNEILAACDMDAKYLWDDLTDEQRKSIVFFTLNRYLSNVQGDDKDIKFHPWLKVKKEKNKKEEFLADLFPNMKREDVATLAAVTTDKEIKKYCEDLGWDKKAINGIKL